MSFSNQAFFQLLEVTQKLVRLLERSDQNIKQLLNGEPRHVTQSTLWVSDWGSAQLAAVEIQESDRMIVLKATLPQVAAEDLEIQVGSETVLIQGEQTETLEVEGYCHCKFGVGRIQSLIPLPCRVYPDIIAAELVNSVLTLNLAKTGEIERQPVKFTLADPCLTTASSLSI